MGFFIKLSNIMSQEKYNLNWHTYSDHLRDLLHNMRKLEYLTDVTLVCDDQRQFKAHKIVLSACGTVFKNIIDSLPLNSSVIYLRGIQHQEMESILEFMYLGVATFYQERMKEFLNVAKRLEIKEISKDVEFNDEEEANDEQDAPETTQHQSKDKEDDSETDSNVNTKIKSIFHSTNGRFPCDQCEKQFTQQINLKTHIKSIHEGVKYPCNQCDYQATQQGSLITHIKSKHEGVKYSCNQCDFQGSKSSNLIRHIKSKHEGVKYPCNQCNFQATLQSNLNTHIKSKHDGIKYACNQCDYQATQQGNLRTHI